jgi:hypothetical protein
VQQQPLLPRLQCVQPWWLVVLWKLCVPPLQQTGLPLLQHVPPWWPVV